MASSISLILHPGHGKCGSTSIQDAIYKQENWLREQGIYIPDSEFQFKFERKIGTATAYPPHRLFADLLAGKTNIQDFEQRLDQILSQAVNSDCKSLIISTERLSAKTSSFSNSCHQVLASKFQDIKVIYYIRRQDDWLLSSWQQWGHKEGNSLQEWLDFCLNKGLPGFLEFSNFFKRIYGESHLSVVPLHKTAWHKENLIADFYHRIGIEFPENIKTDRKANMALNPHLCDSLSRIPNLYESAEDISIKNLLHKYINSRELLFRRDASFFPLNLRQKVMTSFYNENQELHHQFFPLLDFECLFGVEPKAQKIAFDETADNTLNDIESIKEVLAIQTDLLVSILRHLENQKAINSRKLLSFQHLKRYLSKLIKSTKTTR